MELQADLLDSRKTNVKALELSFDKKTSEAVDQLKETLLDSENLIVKLKPSDEAVISETDGDCPKNKVEVLDHGAK